MFHKLFDDENTVDLNRLFDDINKEHFNNKITKIPCVWNIRLRICAGKCHYTRRRNPSTLSMEMTPTKIELSKKLFENNNMDIDKITNTMIHEMVHAYLLEHYNQSHRYNY